LLLLTVFGASRFRGTGKDEHASVSHCPWAAPSWPVSVDLLSRLRRLTLLHETTSFRPTTTARSLHWEGEHDESRQQQARPLQLQQNSDTERFQIPPLPQQKAQNLVLAIRLPTGRLRFPQARSPAGGLPLLVVSTALLHPRISFCCRIG
jgi:hypothetical protein